MRLAVALLAAAALTRVGEVRGGENDDFEYTTFYVTPSVVRVPLQLQIEFRPTANINSSDIVLITLPKFTSGDATKTAGKDIKMGDVYLSPSTIFDGQWIEDNRTFSHELPYNGSQLKLRVKPGASLTKGTGYKVKLYPSNGIMLYCGLPPDSKNFTIWTNATLAKREVMAFEHSPQVGVGCDTQGFCSGHGTCDYCAERCYCYEGYGRFTDLFADTNPKADCSERVCASGASWADVPVLSATTSDLGLPGVRAHAHTECSNAGICERAMGMCDCFDGFTGDACQRRACPMKCSGHGRCETMSELAQDTRAIPLGQPPSSDLLIGRVTYGEEMFESSEKAAYFDAWDAETMQACVCDSSWPVGTKAGQRQSAEWFGVSCSLRRCPTGDDPRTYDIDETDCGNRPLAGGGYSEAGNLCHVDCSNRGTCEYLTGLCQCFPGYYGDNCGKKMDKLYDISR